jgi:hypothetical protein
MHGLESDPTVRVLLVESTGALVIYEGFGSWLQCKRWIAQLSGYVTLRDQLAAVQKRLELKQLATIKEIWTSLHELESVGFHRVDN